VSSVARKIMLIRHAEKPAGSGGASGVAIDGTEDPESLTVRGWTRAGALVGLFAPTHGRSQSADLETPRLAYASGLGKHSMSLRPQETITPLCEKLGLTINTDYRKDEVDEVADDAMSHDGPVLGTRRGERQPAAPAPAA
jgi:broad specificity phosphatase PhoE